MAKISINGIGIGDKCAIGEAFVYVRNMPKIPLRQITDHNKEIERFSEAVAHARKDITAIIATMASSQNKHGEEVLSAQLEFLEDDEYYGAIKNKIVAEKINAEAAVDAVCSELSEEFLALEDEYFRERAADIKDMSIRLNAHLTGTRLRSLEEIKQEVVVVAEDLMPSDTARLNPAYVRAFCTERGTASSHTALLANSLGIPAVVGCKNINIANGNIVVVDGSQGVVLIHPTSAEIKEAEEKIAALRTREKMLIERALAPITTTDGIPCTVLANIGSMAEAKHSLEYGAEGSGLLRTEFFFYEAERIISEKRQYEIYSEIAKVMENKSLTVRTLDIGGDKPLKALQHLYSEEQNPFLGVRGVRLTNTIPKIFESQIRALIRTALEYDTTKVKIMFPLVTNVEEVKDLVATTQKLYTEIAKKYSRHKKDGSPQIHVGIMIEVPSAALLIDHILKYVDFVSIGTNDLTQYLLAADRTNEYVSMLADYCNPAVIQMINAVLVAGKKHNKEVSICGEMASDALVAPLLYGMGLAIYSVSAIRIPYIKMILSQLRQAECQQLAEKCLRAESASEVRSCLREFAETNIKE